LSKAVSAVALRGSLFSTTDVHPTYYSQPPDNPHTAFKMSNTNVGSIYQQIIADVVESSRVDFEEGGVDESVLDELRQVRQLSHCPSIKPKDPDVFLTSFFLLFALYRKVL
jgi:hypothetical protein